LARARGFRIGATCPRKLWCWLRGGGESIRVAVLVWYVFINHAKVTNARLVILVNHAEDCVCV
jgi:hypothetical protein